MANSRVRAAGTTTPGERITGQAELMGATALVTP